eukprot:TRINITY_DN534_c1_g1_i4.p1 TRINITY_DN534_c1_g1~~TRINITY_DN534_c1_g1_i4.p1  ORF type:complete len:173 (-),score=50.69 TRINITY_DN534_c1_g1_i4:68-586(-)
MAAAVDVEREQLMLEGLNLITSSRISELYSATATEDPLVLRRKAADFRKGYKNWRQKKPKGARGETNDLLDREKQHAHDVVEQEREMVQEAQEELDAAVGEYQPGLSRSQSFRMSGAEHHRGEHEGGRKNLRDRSGSQHRERSGSSLRRVSRLAVPSEAAAWRCHYHCMLLC